MNTSSIAMRSQVLNIYKLMHRSVRMYMPTKAAREFSAQRIRTQFIANKYESDPAKIDSLLQRAYSVLMSSIDETARQRLSRL